MIRLRHLLGSVLIHTALFVLLLLNVQWQTPRKPMKLGAPPAIQAVALDRKVLDQMVAEKKRQVLEREKKQDEEKKRKVAEEKRKQDEEKKRKAAEEKRKQEEEQKRKAEEEKRKQEEEQKRKAEEEKRKQEEEQKRKAAEERKRQEQQLLEEQLLAEQEEQAQEQATRNQGIIDKYKVLITQRIVNKFNITGLPAGLNCQLLLRVTAAGVIIRAQILRSSGNEIFDQRAISAVHAAAPYPLPQEKHLSEQMRTIRITFAPDEILQ